ncbi:Cardiolipin synthase [Rubripirellula lacrimiformis]|uniref:Cardiolipin synthase n=1 Tax=Rubripirellula lacrimiformis TaxID=1930273 RepID=A0A517N3Z2_9BACT|nr:cardiolipin synthase [Rubripirellula lacrimiformis]QDT01855.1 Cardiolipin synthase [Rubripirellula lacrimiformis]
MIFFVVIHMVLVVAITLRILWRDDLSSPARLAWIFVIFTVPYFGVIAFGLFGEASLGRTIHRRHAEVMSKVRREGGDALGALAKLNGTVAKEYQAAFRYAASVEGFATTAGNRAELMADAKTARSRLIEDIDRATERVDVLYYIWLNDETGRNVSDALIRAARRGVKCRAMADGLGSRAMIRSKRWQEMSDAGVRVAVALPFRKIIQTILFSRLDLRNHRKITVIDGSVCYCGSQNCADPEFRVKAKYAPWVDILVRLQGPIVSQTQMLFSSDWLLHASDDWIEPASPVADEFPDGIVAQVFGDGPTERHGSTPQLFSLLMGQAQTELTISTPYFVPDQTVLDAICAAAHRGVQVTMIFPKRNDSWIVAAASRSYYRRLLDSGVIIYEFRSGLLHAKTLTVDGVITFIGSSNMDLRSFDLNYENDVLLHDAELTKAVRNRQQIYIADSESVTIDDVQSWSPMLRIWNNVIATLGPVL